MKKSIMLKWVKALRSGKYKQGMGELKNSSRGTHCCLGVLCAISPYKNNFTKMRDGRNLTLPQRVMEWAGITHCAGELSNGTVLTTLNDSGTHSFEDIADLIEKYYKNL